MPPYTVSKSEIQRLIEAEAVRQGLNPALVVAIAQQESWLNPNAVGDNGKSLGLFQLQRAAAIDAGIDPARRGDLHENIRGGVTYFRQKLQQSGGDVGAALSRYNRGTPTYRGIGDPAYVENVLRRVGTTPAPAPSRSLGARVMRAISPRSAEAAPVPQASEPSYEQLRGVVRGGEPAPSAPPTEPDYEQLRAIVRGTPPAASTVPAPAAPPAPAPAAAASAPPTPRSPALAQEQAAAAQQPWWQRALQAVSGASPELALAAPDLPQIEQAVAEMPPEDRRAMRQREGEEWQRIGTLGASTGVSTAATTAGAGIGAALGAPLGPPGIAFGGLVGGMIGSRIGRATNVELGLEAPGPFGDVASVVVPALPGLLASGKSVVGRLARGSRPGQALTAADEATQTTRTVFETEQAAAQAASADAKTSELARLRAREAERLQQVQQRRQVALERHQQREATRQTQATQRQQQAVQAAQEATATQQQQYAQAVETYEQAVGGQRQAVEMARGIPGRYTPAQSPQVLYRKVSEVAPQAPVTLTRTQAVAAELQDTLTQVPGLQPSRMQRVLSDLRAGRETQTLREVQEYLKDIGVLTRSGDATTRRQAKQIFGALHDDLADAAERIPATEAGRDLLLQANAAQRRVFALDDVRGVVRQAISRNEQGQPQIAVGRVLTNLERLYERDRLFSGSFTPEEWREVYGAFEGIAGTPRIPPRPGAPPQPVTPTVVAPYTPRPFAEPAIPPRERVVPQTQLTPPPAVEPTTLPAPVEPVLTKREQGAFRQLLRGVGLSEAVLTGGLGPVSKVALAAEAYDRLAEGLAQIALSPRFRPSLRQVMQADGTVNVEALIALAGGRAALQAEQKKPPRRE